MTTMLVRLKDGVLVEVDAPENTSERISGGAAKRVEAAVEDIGPLLTRVCRSTMSAWDALGQAAGVREVTIELGLSFEGEGNVYVAKAKAGANLTVKLVLTRPTGDTPPKPQSSGT